jgi:endoglucanase
VASLRVSILTWAAFAVACSSATVDAAGGGPKNASVKATKKPSTEALHANVTIPEGLREDDGQHHPAPIAALYMVAPRVLCIVIDDLKVHSFSEKLDWDDKGVDEVQGFDGEAWQRGPWKLTRADGRPISVLSVARDSLPHGSNYSDYGWAKGEYGNLIDFQHALYLNLFEPLGSRETLRIEGPQGLEYRWSFDDTKTQTPVIQLNQVGYSPRVMRRYAYVSWWLGDGGPLPLDDFPAAVDVAGRSLPLVTRPATADLGVPLKQIDLANAPIGSAFRVRIPGVGVSYETEISESSVLRSFYVVSRGLFHNRFGRDTRAEYTNWVRPADVQRHIWTAEVADWGEKFSEKTPKTGARKLAGGHHDAGDFDVRPTHYQVSMLLMEAFEFGREAFSDGQLTLPESGNGIPDLLDEALYSVKGWEDLQESDGGVRLGIEGSRHPWNLTFADEDPMDYWTYARDTRHTLRVAGLFAQAGRLVAPYDAARGKQLIERAQRAYKYAVGHGASDADGGRMLLATGELWRATGDAQYKARFEAVWQASVKWGKYPPISPTLLWASAFNSASDPIIGEYVLGYVTGPGADGLIVAQAQRRFGELASEAVRDLERQGHRHGRNPGKKPSWGEDAAAIRAVLPCVWLLRTGAQDPNCLAALSLARDYSLGANPMSMVWFTGLGERHVEDPRHADSRAFRLKDRDHPERPGAPAVPGIPVYGPISHLKDSPSYAYAGRLTSPPLNDRPLLRRWGDNNFWISANEHDVVHHTLQALNMAVLLSPGQMPPANWLPKGAKKR